METIILADGISTRDATFRSADRGVAAVSSVGGFGALFSAGACCVLPLAFAALGLGSGGLAAFVPYHWPLTIASALALAVGWMLYIRKRRACARNGSCTVTPPSRVTLVMLSFATVFVALSAIWKALLEEPLMAWLAGA